MHFTARQRWIDVTSMARILLHLPAMLISAGLLLVLGYNVLPQAGWLPTSVWLATGLLAFHQPTENVFARYVLGLRRPTMEEWERLAPVWSRVAADAGVDGRAYELWVEDSDTLNALAAAGHIVGVTRFSLDHLPSGQLAAVLAHELCHHTRGHAWSSLLGYWYAAPARLAWAVARKISAALLRTGSCLPLVALLIGGGILAALAFKLWFVFLPLLVAPYLLAAVSRRAELRADRLAASLGFAPMLVELLSSMHAMNQPSEPTTGLALSVKPTSQRSGTPPLLSRLLSSHPDYHTRLHHLRPFLQPPG
jgi:Zn-dependent protease with chaperone function